MEEFGLHEYMGVDKGAVKVEIAQRLKCERINEGGKSIEEGLVILWLCGW